jgi:hypothetical protein
MDTDYQYWLSSSSQENLDEGEETEKSPRFKRKRVLEPKPQTCLMMMIMTTAMKKRFNPTKINL